VRKWWSANVYANGFNNHYNGIYDTSLIDVKFTTFTFNMTNTFNLGKGWAAEVSGWYRTKAAEGILIAGAMGAINTGVTKQVLKKKGTIKLGVRDILNTQQFNGYAKYSDVDVKIRSRRDSRQFNISFSYRFGKTNIAPERRRNSGAADEQNRVNSGGN
jgi:iron complex outermembrane receptor protein